MRMQLVLLLTFCVVVFAKLPAYIKKCSAKDPNFDTCTLNSARDAYPHIVKGEPELKYPVLDPLFVAHMPMAGSGITSTIENSNITGLKDLIMDKLSFDLQKKEISFAGSLPYLNFTGTYTITGRLVNLPISGSGPYVASFHNVSLTYKINYDLQKLDDGQEYMVFQSFDTDIEPQLVVTHLDNMFNGNRLLGDNMNIIMNQNWREIYREVGKPSSRNLAKIWFNLMSEASKTVPYKDMFDDVE